MSHLCRNCGANLQGDLQKCEYCGSAQYFELARIVRFVTESRDIRRHILYPLVMVLGGISFLVIYLLFFSKLSETQLVFIAPFWLFTFLFGYFGYTAESFVQNYYRLRIASVREAFFLWHWKTLPWSLIYAPVPILELKNPLSYALWGSLVYMLSLRAFFLFFWKYL